jgi:hypothetical protein
MFSTRRLLVAVPATTLTVGLALTLAGCRWDMQSQQFTDDTAVSQSITSVHVDSPDGNVTITAGAGPTTVHRVVRYREGKPGVTTSVSGAVLDLKPCGDSCSVDYDIHVPVGTAVSGEGESGSFQLTGLASVDVTSNSGDVTVSGASGPVRAVSDSGSIRVSDAKADVTATTDSGSVTASDIGGSLTARSESGEVSATRLRGTRTSAKTADGDVTVSALTDQDIDASSASGSVTLTVPAGRYHLVTSTGSGRLTTNVPDAPNAAHTLRASAQDGNVSITTA